PGQRVGLHRGHQNHFRVSPGPSTFDTQRTQISGCAGSVPTSARLCQQRTHFGLVVGAAEAAISLPSSASTTTTSPLISRNRNSSTNGASHLRSSALQPSVISASSAAPISPAARIGSSTLATSSRRSSKRSKSAADSGASAGSGASPSYQVANSTLPARAPPAGAGR